MAPVLLQAVDRSGKVFRPQRKAALIPVTLQGCLQPLLPGDGPGGMAAVCAGDQAGKFSCRQLPGDAPGTVQHAVQIDHTEIFRIRQAVKVPETHIAVDEARSMEFCGKSGGFFQQHFRFCRGLIPEGFIQINRFSWQGPGEQDLLKGDDSAGTADCGGKGFRRCKPFFRKEPGTGKAPESPGRPERALERVENISELVYFTEKFPFSAPESRHGAGFFDHLFPVHRIRETRRKISGRLCKDGKNAPADDGSWAGSRYLDMQKWSYTVHGNNIL